MGKHRKPTFSRQPKKGSARRENVRAVQIRRFTGFDPFGARSAVPVLKVGRYHVEPVYPGGMAPKDFVRVSPRAKHGKGIGDWRTWPAFIAKVGHQYYPAESLTEHLMTRVGQICGLVMADSRLMICAGQLRFLSRYFRDDTDILNHGAEILAGHLADVAFVKNVADQRVEKELLTFQDFCSAIRAQFPEDHRDILREFVRMIGFDALVGNQDRHFYNWGVLTHQAGQSRPRFAPIYDSARGLFWNTTEQGLVRLSKPEKLQEYVDGSTPEIGWEGKGRDLNHFGLIERIAGHDTEFWQLLEDLGHEAAARVDTCEGMLDAEFGGLMSPARIDLIKRCLRLRFETYGKIF